MCVLVREYICVSDCEKVCVCNREWVCECRCVIVGYNCVFVSEGERWRERMCVHAIESVCLHKREIGHLFICRYLPL